MSTNSTSPDKVIHIVEKSMPIDQLIMIMYNAPNQIVYDHFRMVNSHLKKDRIEVGQVVLAIPSQ